MNTPEIENQNKGALAERVLSRISGEHMTPRPRWEFLLKNYGLWAFGAIAIILGALAFSVTLFHIQAIDWRLSSATHPDFISFFLAVAPILWVVALVLFILIGYTNVHRTTHGYRYPFLFVMLGAAALSLTFGTGLYAMGVGSAVDETLGDHPPFYRPVLVAERTRWVASDKGVLAGTVTALDPVRTSFTLEDFDGKTWHVDGDDLRKRDLALAAHGGEVRMVGVPIQATSSTFHACFVYPWETKGVSRRGKSAPPLATIPPKTGRRINDRSDECRGIRPYADLHAIEETDDQEE